MSEKNEVIYSYELQEVLNYMDNILYNEFPTNVFTPEYLMISILDKKKSHANLILDACLMSDNLEELKEIYIESLREKTKLNTIIKNSKKDYSEDLNKIIENSKKEKAKTNADKLGTEHILLSILNPENEIKMRDVLNSVGVFYDFVLTKLNNLEITEKKENKLIRPSSNLFNKSQVISASANMSVINNKTEFISKYTTNLNELAKKGKIDNLVGRESELQEIIKVLGRRKKNNVILVGKGGVGKTEIVYGLASLIESGNVPSIIENKEIIMFDIMSLVSGTHFRGMFEERIKGLFDELKSSDKYILFIDDMHNVLKNGSKDKDTDISGMIGNILTEGDIRVIGTTTFKDYRNSIESNTSISRKLQKIIINAPTVSETIDILKQSKTYYEDYHNVEYTDEAIVKAVELSERYITDRSLPDSAFDVIDLAGSSKVLIDNVPSDIKLLKKRINDINDEKSEAVNHGEFEKVDSLTLEENEIKKRLSNYNRKVAEEGVPREIIDVDDIASTVSNFTHVPVNRLSVNEKQKIAHIDEILKESVIGQDDAVNAICRVIKRNKVGLGDKTKTMANILLAGPTGTGKTLIAKKLAEEIFGDEKALIRIDMSEYSEKNSVAKLTGAAPGYVGYENGGQLTEAIKNKQHCVLLLDEIEKADQEVYNLFLQLFDEGRLTDSSGQIVNFKNVIVLMTSNIGAKESVEFGGGLGFNTNETENKKNIIEKSLKRKFTPEFLNRIDKIVYFNSLTDENLNTIVRLEINKLGKRLNEMHYSLNFDDKVVEYLHLEAVKTKEFGARPILRLVQDNIEDKITDLMLENEYKENYEFSATCENGCVMVQ